MIRTQDAQNTGRPPRRFEPLLAATAAALALVALTSALNPVGSDSWRTWADSLVNEYLIWFTLWYLALTGVRACVSWISRARGPRGVQVAPAGTASTAGSDLEAGDDT